MKLKCCKRKGWNYHKGYVVSRTNSEGKEEIMADKKALERLLELEEKYHNFYIFQLPAFHYKRVWLRQEEFNINYTGSYNILSFFVDQGMQNYRQEEMSKLDWVREDDEEYQTLLLQFAQKYFNMAIEDLNKLKDQVIDKSLLKTLNMYNFSKLKPFIGQGIQVLDDKYEEILLTKEENVKYFRTSYFQSEVLKLLKDAKGLENVLVSFEQKKSIQSRLNTLDNEFPEMNTDPNRAELVAELGRIKTTRSKSAKSFKNKFKK